jgi:hypothetical protein
MRSSSNSRCVPDAGVVAILNIRVTMGRAIGYWSLFYCASIRRHENARLLPRFAPTHLVHLNDIADYINSSFS